jgi:DegV family protein with EDD domain
VTRVAVVTDSTANIPEEVLKEYDIKVAPLYIIWDKITYRDGIDIQPDEFYKRLRTSASLPTTSGGIQKEFLEIFEALHGKVDGVVVILVNGAFSAALNSAKIAAELVPELPVKLVDSKLATIEMGFGVIAAAKAAQKGNDMEMVSQTALNVLRKTHMFFCLDSLSYLRRGGRINFPAAVFADLLRVKPILTIKDAKVEVVAKPVSKASAVKQILNMMKEKVKEGPLHAAVMHADDLEGALEMRNTISSLFKCEELFITPFSPVMGAHTGPGCLGVAFYNE